MKLDHIKVVIIVSLYIIIVVSLPKTHLGVAQGSKCQILPCCIGFLLDYLLSSLSVKHIHYLHKAYVCLEFCLNHFLSGGALVPRGLFAMIALYIWHANQILTIKNTNNTKTGRNQSSPLLLLVNSKVAGTDMRYLAASKFSRLVHKNNFDLICVIKLKHLFCQRR